MSPEAIFGIATLVCLCMNIYTGVDTIITPQDVFEEAGSSRRKWMTLNLIGALFAGAALGIVIAVIYLTKVRPKLRRVIESRGLTHQVGPWAKFAHVFLPAVALAGAVTIGIHSAGH